MKIVSTNISNPRTILNGKKLITTGIFKSSVSEIYLGTTDVKNDAVIDRKYHGGSEKACYLYSADHYPFWKEKYPNLVWNWGMFGENITVEGLDETLLNIGDIYKVGEAIIQISEPRNPCNTLALRFEDKNMIKDFLNAPYPGVYIRVITEGVVKKNDAFILQTKEEKSESIEQVYSLLSYNKSNKALRNKILQIPSLSETYKKGIKK